jgi:hypothetical protein
MSAPHHTSVKINYEDVVKCGEKNEVTIWTVVLIALSWTNGIKQDPECVRILTEICDLILGKDDSGELDLRTRCRTAQKKLTQAHIQDIRRIAGIDGE